MATALIGLGANLADRAAMIAAALDALAATERIDRLVASSVQATSPVGGPADQQAYLNAAARVETLLSPQQLHARLVDIENQLGRQREERWGPRQIDLDLLLYDDLVQDDAALTIPHPRMAFRRFVIEPAAEIVPQMRHPTIGWTLAQLRDHLREHRPYVAMAGPIGVGKTRLATELCGATSAHHVVEEIVDDRLAAFYAQPADAAGATGLTWATEIEFLESRTRQLRPERLPNEQLVVSDYWFEQSLAFARVWLAPERFGEYESRWQAAREQVLRPKLLVVLDASVEMLRAAIAERGRPYETAINDHTLMRLRESLFDLIDTGGHGPVLRLRGGELEQNLVEVTAAIAAMQ
ncbi:MAG: 2-amino-4-hydroxy-6-hydroxymethyldihydropteridine diphosphokinase [Planctomycetota bacterium]|nr:MAG: 2-amino-4-hydroxy-6-hydroxymethyldihydropteridine diphosphokinase [Planctomycetota bacterium]